jgi:CheY-like chemotaxis protein
MFSDRAAGKGIELSLDESGLPGFFIDSDAARIRQILLNLVGNAIKFTASGSVTVSGRYTLLPGDSIRVTLTVQDTGIGLSTETAQRLFTPFVQGESGPTRKYGGTGLGLALSKKLGEALGGDVRIEQCSPGGGCTFAFDLIAQKTAPGKVPAQPDVDFSDERHLEGLRVLVIDDATENRYLIQTFLRREGASVDVAEDGETGIIMAESQDYDAVLMDIQMPGISGYEALAKLKQHNYRKPIIALTAHALLEERTRALQAGFNDHVAKPVNAKDLTSSILKQVRH